MKNFYKKIILAISIAVFLTGSVYTIVNIYQDSHKIIATEYFNEHFDVVTFKNRKVALLSKITNKISSPKVDKIFDPDEDTLCLFITEKKYGYLNSNTGEIVIKPSFVKAWDFDMKSGLAAVIENDKIGFIDRTGNYVIKPQYKYATPNYLEDIMFSEGFCVIPNGKGKFGVINTKNQIVLPIVYEKIEESILGYKIVKVNGKYGLADSLYMIVINPEFDNIAPNHQGIVITDYNSDKQYMLDYDYKTVIAEYAFDNIEKIVINDSYYDEATETEYISYSQSGFSKFTINGKCGVIDDETGKIIIPAKWDDIQYHDEGVFKAELDSYFFLINIKGEIIN